MAFPPLPDYLCPYGADMNAFDGKQGWLNSRNGMQHYAKHCREFCLPDGSYISQDDYLAIACLIQECPLEGTVHWIGADGRDYFWHPPTGILVVAVAGTPITMFRTQPMRILRRLSNFAGANPVMTCQLWENGSATTSTVQNYLAAYWHRVQQQHPAQPHWQDEVFDLMDVDDSEEWFDAMDIDEEDLMDVDDSPVSQPLAEVQPPAAFSPQQAQMLDILAGQTQLMQQMLWQQQAQAVC